jgi:hypothetical protein
MHEFDLYALMSSGDEENLKINTWSRKFAIGYDSDGWPEGVEKKSKKKKKKKDKKKEKRSHHKKPTPELIVP